MSSINCVWKEIKDSVPNLHQLHIFMIFLKPISLEPILNKKMKANHTKQIILGGPPLKSDIIYVRSLCNFPKIKCTNFLAYLRPKSMQKKIRFGNQIRPYGVKLEWKCKVRK